MSPFFVIVVMVDEVHTVHGSYLKQARAEEDAARIRRGLKGHPYHSVRVQPVQFATVRAVRELHGLDKPAETLIVDPRSPSGFKAVS